METLKQIIRYLIILIDAGASMRLMYCFIQMTFNPDEVNSYKKKMIHLGVFLILANSALEIALVVKKYVI